MSGEFGGYHGGYLYAQLSGCADDFRAAQQQTKNDIFCAEHLADLADLLADIGQAVAYRVACDCGPDEVMFRVIDDLPKLIDVVNRIQNECQPIIRVVEQAKRHAVEAYLREAEDKAEPCPPP